MRSLPVIPAPGSGRLSSTIVSVAARLRKKEERTEQEIQWLKMYDERAPQGKYLRRRKVREEEEEEAAEGGAAPSVEAIQAEGRRIDLILAQVNETMEQQRNFSALMLQRMGEITNSVSDNYIKLTGQTLAILEAISQRLKDSDEAQLKAMKELRKAMIREASAEVDAIKAEGQQDDDVEMIDRVVTSLLPTIVQRLTSKGVDSKSQ